MKAIRYTLFLVLWPLALIRAQGTEPTTPAIPLTSVLVQSLEVPSGSSLLQHAFPVIKSDSMHVSVLLPPGDLAPSLVSPLGETLAWNLASNTYSCLVKPVQVDTNSPVLAQAYHFTLLNPADGIWTLRCAFRSALTTIWKGILNADFASDLGAGLFATVQEGVVGQPVAISLILMDGSSIVTGFQCEAQLTGGGGPPMPLAFQPMTNPQTGNTTLVAQATPSNPGEYFAIAKLTGTLSGKPYERTAVAAFTFHAPKARITGQFSERLEVVFPSTPD